MNHIFFPPYLSLKAFSFYKRNNIISHGPSISYLHLHRLVRLADVVGVGGEVVNPAAPDLALSPELVHPGCLYPGGGGGHQHLVGIPLLDHQPLLHRLEGRQVRVTRLIGLIKT